MKIILAKSLNFIENFFNLKNKGPQSKILVKKKVVRFFCEKKLREFFYKNFIKFNNNFFDLKNEASQLKN